MSRWLLPALIVALAALSLGSLLAGTIWLAPGPTLAALLDPRPTSRSW